MAYELQLAEQEAGCVPPTLRAVCNPPNTVLTQRVARVWIGASRVTSARNAPSWLCRAAADRTEDVDASDTDEIATCR